MRPRTNLLVLVACALLAVSMTAQGPPDPNAQVMAGPVVRGGFTMHLEAMDAAPVKGVPFCANISTEHTQSFADGNRIHSSDSSTLCRDSEGRTRREAGLNLLGAGPEKSPPKLITILDPVAGVRYMLDPENKTAHRMSLSAPGPGAPPDLGKHVMVFRNGGPQESGGASTDFFYHKAVPDHEAAGTTENIGDQTINGIHATGTRMTHTIPAGQMGNEKPIVVTSERWYSQDLKATVMTKHDDPWAGELKTEFTSVNTAEPDASLFTVPSDYKIVEDKDGPIMMHRFMAPAPQ
jgi:hypothetical protein